MHLRSIRSRLLLAFLALGVLPLLLAGGILVWQSYQMHVGSILVHQRDMAARVAVELDIFFHGVEDRLLRVNLLRDFAKLDAVEQQRTLSILLTNRHDFREIALVGADGRERVRVSAGEPVFADGLRDRGGTEEFRWPLASGKTYAGDVHYDPDTGEPLMMVAVPLVDRRSGRVEAVLAGEVRVRPIWNIMASADLAAGESVYLLDAQGRVIAHRDPSIVLREVHLVQMPTAGRGRGLSGEDAYLVSRDYRVGQQPLTIVAEYAVFQALLPAQKAIAAVVAVFLIALALVLSLYWYAVRRIVRPVESMSGVAKAVREGDLGRRAEIAGDDEIGELATSFNAMTTELQAAIEHRQRALEEIEDLYNRAPCGYHSLGADGLVLRINDTELAWLGYERAEVVGKLRLPELLTPDSQRIFREQFPRFKQQGSLKDLELEMVRKDGTTLPVLVNASTVLDAKGNFLASRTTLFDITDRRAAERALHDLNADLERRVAERTSQLEAANKELEAFAYSVSHDLRAPLRAIDGFSQIVLEDYGDRVDEEGRRLLNVVRQNTERMNQLISDILSFSRMGRRELETTPVDVGRLAGEVFEELRAAVPERHLRLELAELPPAEGDRAMVRQVLVNLLANAIKFTQPRPEAVIEVGGRSDQGENEYWVRDNGVGFDMAYADKLFGVFQRLHSDEQFEGTGIGLAIVKRIIARHGGRVWAEGRLDEGAVFHFTLPPMRSGDA